MRKFALEYQHIKDFTIIVNGVNQTVNPLSVTAAQVTAMINEGYEFMLEPIPA